jgi:hypothetical protein
VTSHGEDDLPDHPARLHHPVRLAQDRGALQVQRVRIRPASPSRATSSRSSRCAVLSGSKSARVNISETELACNVHAHPRPSEGLQEAIRGRTSDVDQRVA